MIKLYNFITFILIVYIATMAYMARDLIIVDKNYLGFSLLMGLSLIMIFLLRYTIKQREKKNSDE